MANDSVWQADEATGALPPETHRSASFTSMVATIDPSKRQNTMAAVLIDGSKTVQLEHEADAKRGGFGLRLVGDEAERCQNVAGQPRADRRFALPTLA